MTYKEKLKEIKPDKVNPNYTGGCYGCPKRYFNDAPPCRGVSESNCEECWNTEMPASNPTTEIDIRKIIDDAMEKKDREVMIFISKDHTNVSVIPVNSTKPRWIDKETTYVCSECGALNKWPSPFCPLCGEKLAISVKEATDDESTN